MTEELLKLVREEVAKSKEKIEKENQKIDRIKELEKDSAVSEYIDLRNLRRLRESKLEFSDYLYFKAFQAHKPKTMLDTNGMYVLSYEGKYMHHFRIKDYRQYTDIESGEDAIVGADNIPTFEENHVILEGIGHIDAQKEFLKMAVEQGQEEAVKVMAKKYGKRKESK